MSDLTREEISRLLALLHNTSGDCAGRDNIIGRKLYALTSKDTVSISRECAKILLRDRYDMLMESWRKPLCDEWLRELSKALQQQEQGE